MFKIKKAVKLLALVLTLSLSTCLFASNVNCGTISPDSNTKAPGGIGIFGTSSPTTSVSLLDGKMTFSGSATGSILYTNNCFTGKSIVSYTISNSSKSKLTVKLYKKGWNLAISTTTINAGASVTGAFAGLDTTTDYYLSFSAPSDFAGSVS